MTSNIKPKTIFTGDNLPIMRGMNSASVDLIYLDPPFNSNANYAAPIGSKSAGAEFKDTWTLDDVDNAWLDLIETKYPALNRVIHAAMTNSDKSYLIYMAARLLEMKRILKDTGSIYLHCDPTMSHYLKLVMDAVFGRLNFRNEIVWCYERGTRSKSQFGRKHDVILFYSKTKNYVFHSDAVRVERRKTHMKVETDSEGRTWQVKKDAKSGKVYRYSTDVGVLCPDWWIGIQQLNRNAKEKLGYPTQKPLALLERVIKASSDKGDVVFDPFCGCATTLVAADRLQREWIGIDISEKAAELVVARIREDQGLFRDIIARTDIPKRTDLGEIPRYNAPENKTRLYGEQEGYCSGCGVHFEMRNLEVDHIIAENVGGTGHIENLQLLCGSCNRIKGDRGQEYLISRLNAS